MNISLDDDIITDDNDTEDIISESQPHDYTSDNIINTHQLSTGIYCGYNYRGINNVRIIIIMSEYTCI